MKTKAGEALCGLKNHSGIRRGGVPGAARGSPVRGRRSVAAGQPCLPEGIFPPPTCTCTHTLTHACTHGHRRLSAYVCMRTWAHTCTCLYRHTCVYAHIQTPHTHTHTCVHTHAPMSAHARTCIHAGTHTQCMYGHVCVHTWTHVHACARTACTFTHMHTHECAHTHMHTHVSSSVVISRAASLSGFRARCCMNYGAHGDSLVLGKAAAAADGAPRTLPVSHGPQLPPALMFLSHPCPYKPGFPGASFSPEGMGHNSHENL